MSFQSASSRLRRRGRAFRWASPRRSGMNLTEVLVATFIGVTGVVFVAAMIPIGMHQLGSAIRSDRGSTAAHQGWAEAEVRGLLQFVDENGVAMLQTAGGTPVSPTIVKDSSAGNVNCGLIQPGGSKSDRIVDRFSSGGTGAFAIDPWGISFNSTLECFPYLANGATMVKPGYAIPRLTIRSRIRNGGSWTYGSAIPSAVAQRMFTSTDDPAFSQDRIDQLLRPERAPNGNTSILERDRATEIRGEYTWMYTVSPILSSVGTSSTALYTNTSYVDRPIGTDMWDYHVSTAVFFRRPPPSSLSPPVSAADEFRGNIRFLNPAGASGADSGLGGGEAMLDLTGVGANTPSDSYPRPAVGDWIMVYKQIDEKRFDRARCYEKASDMSQLAPPTVARWYRIRAVDPVVDASSSTMSLRVLLDGPDWDYSLFDMTGGNGFQATFAYCKRVVSVVERTVRLEY